MKGDPKVLEALNSLLAHELTVVNQYMVHAEMCDNWGYGKLHSAIEKRARNEMKHAEMLIGRTLFLEGTPAVKLNKILIGSDVPQMFDFDREAEADAIKAYNSGIVVCGEARDFATREVLEHILNDEDDHIHEIEVMHDEVGQMGIQSFLSKQMG